jgi:hypothetical protein
MRGDRHVPEAASIVAEQHQDEQEAARTVKTTKKSAATIWPA